jgi:hypothetical protein
MTKPKGNRTRGRHAARRKPATLQAGHEGRFETGEAIMDDPYEPGRKVTVNINLRHDVLTHWQSRKLIDAAQFLAGRRFQRIWHRAQFGGVAGVRFDQPRVDGGTRADPLTDRMLDARRELAELAGVLGLIDYPLMGRIVGEGRSLEAEGASGAWGSREPQLYVARRVRDALAVLAAHWGATGHDRLPIRAERIPA